MRSRDAPNRVSRQSWLDGYSGLSIVGVGMLLPCIQVAAQSLSSDAVQVETPEEFQEQVRKGTPHIVITQHLNMRDTPRFQETTTGMDDGMVAIVRSGSAITQTIRGNCTTPPTDNLDPPRRTNTQCVISIREDFLEVPSESALLWLSDLYVKLLGVEKEHSTLIGVHSGDAYLTNMTFVGDGTKARAIDVKVGRKLYVANSLFLAFQKDRDTVIRLEPGATATVSNCTFERNEAQSLSESAVPAGPIAGLKDDALSEGAAIWFHGCLFRESNQGGLPGDVAVETRQCHVYSNTFQPTVWDIELNMELSPWLIAPREDGLITSESVFGDLQFPSEADSFFTRIVKEQAAATGMPEVTPTPLPAGNTFITKDPYPSETEGVDTALVGGVLAAAAGLLAIVVLAVVFLRRQRNKQHMKEAEGCTASHQEFVTASGTSRRDSKQAYRSKRPVQHAYGQSYESGSRGPSSFQHPSLDADSSAQGTSARYLTATATSAQHTPAGVAAHGYWVAPPGKSSGPNEAPASGASSAGTRVSSARVPAVRPHAAPSPE